MMGVYCCEELWKKDADTVTPIIVTKLQGSALFIQLYCMAERQDTDGRKLVIYTRHRRLNCTVLAGNRTNNLVFY